MEKSNNNSIDKKIPLHRSNQIIWINRFTFIIQCSKPGFSEKLREDFLPNLPHQEEKTKRKTQTVLRNILMNWLKRQKDKG